MSIRIFESATLSVESESKWTEVVKIGCFDYTVVLKRAGSGFTWEINCAIGAEYWTTDGKAPTASEAILAIKLALHAAVLQHVYSIIYKLLR